MVVVNKSDSTALNIRVKWIMYTILPGLLWLDDA